MPTNDYANCVYQGNGLVELAIRVQACKWELSSNYLELSSKSLDATAKIDEDIAADIMDLDR